MLEAVGLCTWSRRLWAGGLGCLGVSEKHGGLTFNVGFPDGSQPSSTSRNCILREQFSTIKVRPVAVARKHFLHIQFTPHNTRPSPLSLPL